MPDSSSLDSAFTALVSRHGPAMRRIARVYAQPHGETEDLYQEILFQVWRGLPSFRGESGEGTWLYRVALNTALGWKRKAARRPESVGDLEPETAGVVHADGTESAILESFLASLSPVDRSILILYMEGIAHRGIGEVMGISEGAVGVRIHRIKGQFKAMHLEGHDGV